MYTHTTEHLHAILILICMRACISVFLLNLFLIESRFNLISVSTKRLKRRVFFGALIVRVHEAFSGSRVAANVL